MSSEQQDAAAKVEEWPRVVELKHPLSFGSETVASLAFQRGRLEHIKGMKIDGVPAADQLMLIASRLCGKPVKVIEMLDPDDASEVLAIALLFFNRCLGVG